MKLSVIICCYNEVETILAVIRATQAVELGPNWTREIVVVDNASTDGTRELLQKLDDPDLRIVFQPRNMGKGMSIRTAIEKITGDYFLIQDADLEYDPAEHRRFCDYVEKNRPKALFGSRVLGGKIVTKYWRTFLGNRLLTWLTNIMFNGNLTDVATATKMVQTDVARSLNLVCTDFNLDFELPNKLLLAGYPIEELPISYNPRTYEQGKKIKFRHAIQAIITILRDRFGLTPLFVDPDRPVAKQSSR